MNRQPNRTRYLTYRMVGEGPMSSLHEAGYKFQAKLYLIHCTHNPGKVVAATQDEFIGINLLKRDGELVAAAGWVGTGSSTSNGQTLVPQTLP